MLKKLFWGSTDFTEAIFKIPQISKHFSAMLRGGTFSRQARAISKLG